MLIQHFCFNIEGASQISRNTNSSHSKNLRSSDPVTAQGLQNFASLPSPLCYLHKYFNNATSLPLLRAESTSHNIYTLTFTFSWNNSLSLFLPLAVNDSLNFSQITLFVCGDPFSNQKSNAARSTKEESKQWQKTEKGPVSKPLRYPVCARFEQSAASPPLYHYHTGTSSNRRRLMYARFVSVFEFRIQMAHLPCESGWVTGPTGGGEKDG